MNEDYLWDRSGQPDPEIQRLEETLGTLRYRLGTPPRPAKRVWPVWAGVAAAAVLVVSVAWLAMRTPGGQPTVWQVAAVGGTPQMGGQRAAVSMPVRTGQALRTDGASRLTLQAGNFGAVDLGPNSELSVAASRAGAQQMTLRRGMVHALIWAPPRQFVVDMPSARATDLGCEYTITMDDQGNGLLRVERGWVAFQFKGHESFIPAGAACFTRKKSGPGVPYFEDAAETFRSALASYENGDPSLLPNVLAAARPRDALTLWHLLGRAPERQAGPIFDRFAQLVTLPAEVTREAALRKEGRMLDLSWNALNLENTEWWRGWERPWK